MLGVREGLDRPLLDGFVAYLEPRVLLLVLDNCEHLVDACARLAERLLDRCPDLRIPGTTDPYCAAPFPEELPRRCITLFSFPGDVVADPFCGRGWHESVASRPLFRALGARAVM
jgi:DNA methylase